MKSANRDAAVDVDDDTAPSQLAHTIAQDIDSRYHQARTAPELGSALLPAPVANFVSFATRSTGLAVRVTGTLGGYGLDVAKLTTLSTLQLGRAVLYGVLSRAGKDTTKLTDAEAEVNLVGTIEKLHSRVDQFVFWAATGFQLTSTALSMWSETSQLLLSTLDQFFGSTDSSRAIASIITMVRREFTTPPMGGQGETVSVADLVTAFCTLAFLQRSCRAYLEEENRKFGMGEIVWDVVVLNNGVRVDVHEENLHPPPATHTIAPMQKDGQDTRPEIQQLEREIMKSLPDNARVSITREIITSETIRVNIIGDVQQISVEPPPGIELVEENRDTCQVQAEQGATITCSQFVFRHEHRRERRMSLQVADGDLSLVAGYGEDELEPELLESLVNGDSDTPRLRPHGTETEMDAHQAGVSPSELHTLPIPRIPSPLFPDSDADDTSLWEPIQLADAIPPPPPSTLTLQSMLSNGSASSTRGDERDSYPKLLEKKSVFRSVLKRSMSVFNKNDASSKAAAGKVKHMLAAPFPAKILKNPQRQPPRLVSTRNRSSSKLRGGARAAPKVKPGELYMTPKHGRSCGSLFTMHESVHQSATSLTETYSIASTNDRRPSSVFSETAISQGIKEVSSEMGLGHVPDAPARNHQRKHSHALSIYTLAAKKSATSLGGCETPRQTITSSSTEKLSALRQAGRLHGMFPERHFLANIARYMRFASAAYGSNFLKVLGIAMEMPVTGISDDTHYELRFFAHHTRSKPSSILLSSFVDPQGGSDGSGATNTGVPLVHYISLDHESRAVVLACRGTLGFEDVLTDMACEYDDLVWRGQSYKVHKGVHASAKRLLYGGDGRVLFTLKAALEEFPGYGLVLTGHSLGAAVTSLLGIMLSEPDQEGGGGAGTTPFVTSPEPHTNFHPRSTTTPPPKHLCLPAGRPIHVYAYGPPATLSAALRAATRGLVTTVVNGNDLVPYLSLGVLHDVQGVALAIKGDKRAAKTELAQRVWRGLVSGLADPSSFRGGGVSSSSSQGGGQSNNNDDGDVGGGGGGGDAESSYASLKVFRVSMMAEKLVPPGEVFVVESTPVLRRRREGPGPGLGLGEGGGGGSDHFGEPAQRMVLKYVEDVERRFGEVRFGSGMLTDHNPGRYEAALERLMVGVGVRE
ncbi:hypothetical protein C8A00DRAFT_19580 [Chaetomidium leptoderma]|uniref:sn-1-specific diacylglycerol lipase n=1 Tax=Chaetomidium leptoderma TaxID=669021 RepID=A0AAN6VC11_9PEZI|nr:hypothetical protein C8A00DRAFT_19580 [Chaetomidium leptoderma]